MNKRTYARPLPVGKSCRYTFMPNPKWLQGATIINPEVTNNKNVIKGDVTTDGRVIQVMLTGSNVGDADIHFSYSTSDGQSGCYTGVVKVIDC